MSFRSGHAGRRIPAAARTRGLVAALFWALATGVVAEGGGEHGPGAPKTRTDSVSRAEAERGKNGRASRVRLHFGAGMSTLPDHGAVREWVAGDLHRQIGLAGNDRLAVADHARPLGEGTVVRLWQTAGGLPVVYRESRLILDRGRRPVHLLGHHSAFADLPSTRPRLSVAGAFTAAGGVGTGASSSRLLFWPSHEGLRLSYELEGTFPDADRRAAPYQRVYVDAATGEVLQRLPLLHTIDRRVHDFSRACREAGVHGPVDPRVSGMLLENSPLVRSETINRGDRYSERLFDVMGQFSDFLGVSMDMDSFDDEGAPLVGYLGVEFHDEYSIQCVGNVFNAAWLTSNVMLLPHEALKFPEIIGHEFTHGLINTGSGLIYKDESGALNEAISDAVGLTFVGWVKNGAPRDPRATLTMRPGNWQLRAPDGVLRDMKHPRRYDLPDHYDDYQYVDYDHGGVHINSSIVNQAFYLLSEGGRHPRLRRDPEVEGIGAMNAARIYGAAAAWVLGPNSDFEDARYAFAHVAELLHGEGSREWVAVHTAMDAVGIPGRWELAQPTPEPEPQPQTETTAPPPQPATTPESAPQPQPAPTQPQTEPPTQPERQQQPATPSPPQPSPQPAPQPQPTPPPGAGTGAFPLVTGLMLLAGLALLVAIVAILKHRPWASSAAAGPASPPAPSSRRERGPAPRPAPPAGPAPRQGHTPPAVPSAQSKSRDGRRGGPDPEAPPRERIAGTLRALSGAESIPLPRAQLSSPEGLVVGRTIGLCHVQIRDPSVSRRHIRLRLVNGVVLVEDLNTLRGTSLDGAALQAFNPRPLHPGQTLDVGGFLYRMDGPGNA